MESNEFLYMLGVVGAGCALTFAMRSLPFLLFAGRDRELPQWVTRFGSAVSPVVIAALIVYSYSGLQWRTAWPYLASALTVAVHLWKGNSLASIAAGTALYMALVASFGCVSTPVETVDFSDPMHPAFKLTRTGITYKGRYLKKPQEVLDILRDNNAPRDKPVLILIGSDVIDRQLAHKLQFNCLRPAGYTRSVLVHETQSSASGIDPEELEKLRRWYSEPAQQQIAPAQQPRRPANRAGTTRRVPLRRGQ